LLFWKLLRCAWYSIYYHFEQDALIKVLRGSRQLTNEWQDAEKRNTIISPLTHGNIIDNSQVPDIITLVSKATYSPDNTVRSYTH
jgi:hypothetical protein